VKERGAYLKHLSGRSHGLVESAESSSPSETAAAVDVRVPRVSAWLGTAAEPALSESLQTAGRVPARYRDRNDEAVRMTFERAGWAWWDVPRRG
jgi:hypothetical protein